MGRLLSLQSLNEPLREGFDLVVDLDAVLAGQIDADQRGGRGRASEGGREGGESDEGGELLHGVDPVNSGGERLFTVLSPSFSSSL